MAALIDVLKKGSVSRSVTVRIIDSGDGTPETGVVFNSPGIDLWYRRQNGAVVPITEVTLAALTTGWTAGGFLAMQNGEYRVDIPDAAFATGANHVDIGGTVTGMVVIGGRVRLVDYDPEDTIRLGLTALPNAPASATGGLGPTVARGGTAQGGTATTITLDASANAADDYYNGSILFIVSGTGGMQSRLIKDYVGATKVATVDTWAVTPSASSVFVIHAFGAIPANLDATGNVTLSDNSLTAAKIATDAITAAKIAADAIGASELAADAVAEIVTAVFARAFSAAYGSHTFDELMKLLVSVIVGKVSGMQTNTPVFRNLADSGNVVSATTTVDGNRTVVTRTP